MTKKEIYNVALDYVYKSYKCENSLLFSSYMHHGRDELIEALMSKEEFVVKLNCEPEDYRWNTALSVLCSFMYRSL